MAFTCKVLSRITVNLILLLHICQSVGELPEPVTTYDVSADWLNNETRFRWCVDKYKDQYISWTLCYMINKSSEVCLMIEALSSDPSCYEHVWKGNDFHKYSKYNVTLLADTRFMQQPVRSGPFIFVPWDNVKLGLVDKLNVTKSGNDVIVSWHSPKEMCWTPLKYSIELLMNDGSNKTVYVDGGENECNFSHRFSGLSDGTYDICVRARMVDSVHGIWSECDLKHIDITSSNPSEDSFVSIIVTVCVAVGVLFVIIVCAQRYNCFQRIVRYFRVKITVPPPMRPHLQNGEVATDTTGYSTVLNGDGPVQHQQQTAMSISADETAPLCNSGSSDYCRATVIEDETNTNIKETSLDNYNIAAPVLSNEPADVSLSAATSGSEQYHRNICMVSNSPEISGEPKPV